MPSANHNVELHLRYTNCDSSLSPIPADNVSYRYLPWFTSCVVTCMWQKRTKSKTQVSQDQDQDQDFSTWVSRRLETKSQVSRTTSLLWNRNIEKHLSIPWELRYIKTSECKFSFCLVFNFNFKPMYYFTYYARRIYGALVLPVTHNFCLVF